MTQTATHDSAQQVNRHPILYSFRRCPYAIRTRMILKYSEQTVELRDILLKDKPQTMLDASPKGTVPVLVLTDGTVIDESMDIIYWALAKQDRDHYYHDRTEQAQIQQLIQANDGPFKAQLDKYKYANRHPQKTEQDYRQQAEFFLEKLELQLQHADNTHNQRFLFNNKISLADVAIMPFIRQFAFVDKDWFDQAPYPLLQQWLDYWLQSELFISVMKKHPIWQQGEPGVLF